MLLNFSHLSTAKPVAICTAFKKYPRKLSVAKHSAQDNQTSWNVRLKLQPGQLSHPLSKWIQTVFYLTFQNKHAYKIRSIWSWIVSMVQLLWQQCLTEKEVSTLTSCCWRVNKCWCVLSYMFSLKYTERYKESYNEHQPPNIWQTSKTWHIQFKAFVRLSLTAYPLT